jgi:hypothetical protein
MGGQASRDDFIAASLKRVKEESYRSASGPAACGILQAGASPSLGSAARGDDGQTVIWIFALFCPIPPIPNFSNPVEFTD